MALHAHRIGLLLSLLVAFAPTAARAATEPPREPGAATYRIRIVGTDPLRLAVTATLPAGDGRIVVAGSRPGGIPELDADGWPAVFTKLRAVAADGRAIATTPVGTDGWRLAERPHGAVTLHYELDLSAFEKLGWPAPRESAFARDGAIVLAGRAVFVASPAQRDSHVAIEAPAGWHVSTPWPRGRDGAFVAAGPDDLFDNLFALTRDPPETVDAGGLAIAIVAIGDWRAVRDEARAIVAAMTEAYVRMMPPAEREHYLMVLLPQRERGGESFRNSFAMNVDAPPGKDNRAAWGGTLAHELFHYWNGWRLRGSDYAATQWFQEGFTEYMANKTLLAAGLLAPEEFLQEVQQQVVDVRRLETPLDAPGTRKGPPLYGGGALVALCWDVAIREASDGAHTLADVFAALWRTTDRGAQAYDWQAIHAALRSATARPDWADFHARHIAAREPLPVEPALRALGLRLEDGGEASVRIVADADAGDEARERWRDFVAR